jgi:hypothetical protein
MSTKQQTTNSATQSQQQSGSSQGGFSNLYDPASMARYQTAQGQALGGLQEFANNPFQSSFFNTLAQMQRQNVGQQGQSAVQSLLQNARTSGYSTSSPYMQSLMAQQSRAQSGQQAQGFNSLLAMMPGLRMQALGMMQGGFNPLQTGGTQQQSYKGNMTGQQNSQQTQQMSGLGTWLPQLIGGALGAAGGFMGGGPLSAAMKSATSGGFPSPNAPPNSPFGTNMFNPSAGIPNMGGMGSAGSMNLGGTNFGGPSPFFGPFNMGGGQ